jgi:hypothetical protein
LTVGTTEYRWSLVEALTVDLVDPKETRVSGADLVTTQGTDIVSTGALTDFNAHGVVQDDVLRILEGPDAGDYTLVADPIAPNYTTIQVDTELTRSGASLDYLIFRPNATGGIERPLLRLTSVELLDSSGQTQGTIVPYAKPVDIQSRSFQNPARGVKHEYLDATLGIVSNQSDASDQFTITGGAGALVFGEITVTAGVETLVTTPIDLGVGGAVDRTEIISRINAALSGTFGPNVAVEVGADRLGIRPVIGPNGGQITVEPGGTDMAVLFPFNARLTAADIRSAELTADGGWNGLDPAMDWETGLDLVQILSGNQVGYVRWPYSYSWPGNGALFCGDIYDLDPYNGFGPEAGVKIQLGSRSLGSARMYFLEPTSIEVDTDTYFTVTADDGILRYFPDPTLDSQRLPPLPSGDTLEDGSGSMGASPGVLTSAVSDFALSGIRVGDKCIIKYFPIQGTAVLANPVPNLAGTTFQYTIDNGPERTVTFVNDDASIASTDVTQQGVVDQINSSMGSEICSLASGDELKFQATVDLTLSTTGTANSIIIDKIDDGASGIDISTATYAQRSNASPIADTYTVASYTTDTLTFEEDFPSPTEFSTWPSPTVEQIFTVNRTGTQRISTTEMVSNTTTASLYYWDVELVSEGAGDTWNLEVGQQMTISGYRSDGYYLTSDDDTLTFSDVEEVDMIISRTILTEGVDDHPSNATQVTNQNLQISYSRVPLITDVQNFVTSQVERVICSNPLARHLIPYFVRFDLNYTGGSTEEVVVPDVEEHINNLYPTDLLEVSDIEKIVMDRGATSITNPLDLIALIHNPDRSIWAERSQDSLGASRLTTFIPDVLDITRLVT